jgi:hypothetical protein
MDRIKRFFACLAEYLTLFLSACFYGEPESKIKGLKWVIHKNDVGPFPSLPHLHAKEIKLLWGDKKMVAIIKQYIGFN